ncbi:MAG: type VI secretion system protein TssA [Planctomycetia bacterium]|nr:type VI secretion system protein TssA [Planctomycetia bacterium]
MDIDLEAVAQPISPDQPAGPDLRADESRNNIYFRLRDVWDVARRKEREALNSDPDHGDQGSSAQTESITAWRSVNSLAAQLVSGHAKDLEAAAFLIQSSLRVEGTRGLGVALTVARILVENFWNDLYPQIGEEGLSSRLRPIESLSTAPSLVIEPLRRMAVANSAGQGEITFSQYLSAASGRGSPSMPDVERVAQETDTGFYVSLFEELSVCQRELATLSQQLDEKSGVDESGTPQGPSLGDLKKALDDYVAAVQHLSKGRVGQAVEAAGVEADSPGGDGAPSAGVSVPGRLESRSDALRMLVKVAEFFERQDPHSLLGAQVRKVVKLANMSPAEYYSELLEDHNARLQLFKLVGIDPPRD